MAKKGSAGTGSSVSSTNSAFGIVVKTLVGGAVGGVIGFSCAKPNTHVAAKNTLAIIMRIGLLPFLG